MVISIDEFAMVMVGGAVAHLVVPSIARVADGGHGAGLVHDHAFKDAVIGEVAADAALALEDEVVVVSAVGSIE